MYDKEKRGCKVCICMLFGLAATFFLAVGILYSVRASNAAKINEDYKASKIESNPLLLVP